MVASLLGTSLLSLQQRLEFFQQHSEQLPWRLLVPPGSDSGFSFGFGCSPTQKLENGVEGSHSQVPGSSGPLR